MPEPIRLENGYGCYCADCAGSWEQADKAIRLCSCPCHEDDEDEEGAELHDDTCDCDECCGDDVDHEEAPVPGCNCHDCIR
jgi:hypothetical protein